MLQNHLKFHNSENEKSFKMKMKTQLFLQDINLNKLADWRTAIRYCNKMPTSVWLLQYIPTITLMYVKSVHLNEYNMGIKIPESPNHFYR